jgi:ferredoxin-NADP reductase
VDSVTPDGPRRAPIRWYVATVRDARAESPTARTLVLDVPAWPGHRAGHHVDVRLTAEDGYQASRSYSIASAPGHDAVELTIERFEDGEVSPYLVDDVIAGDQFLAVTLSQRSTVPLAGLNMRRSRSGERGRAPVG